ncbi:MAG: glycosyltransferase [Mucilaginibacter sp.]
MPKILTILNRNNIGGIAFNVAYLAKYMDPAYKVEILTGYKEPYEGSSAYIFNELGLHYTFVPEMYRSVNVKKDFGAYQFIKTKIGEYQPDIVHTHAAKPGVLGRLAAYYSINKPKAIIHTYHGNVFDGYFPPLKTKLFLAIERYLAGKSDAIIAISEQQKDDLVNKYRIAPANKVHVIRLGFDLDKFAHDNEQKRVNFRKFYHISEEAIVITITGRLTAIKNHFLFIDALNILKHQYPALEIKVFIVGDGELLEPIMDKLSAIGFSFCRPGEDNHSADIIFTSWRKDIDVINAGSDIIALSSLNEGTPVSIIEALASQKAVVCTNVGGVKDVVKDGYSGLLTGQTADEFANKLQELCVNKQFRDVLAANGKAFVMQNYSYSRLVKETEDLYKFLLD